MTDLNHANQSNLDGYKSDGTVVTANRIMTGGSLTALGCTLALNTTYYFPFGAQHSPVPAEVSLTAVQVRWDAGIIMVVTIETTLFPATVLANDPRGVQLTDWDTTAGYWIPQNPPTAYIPVVGGTVGTGATAMTVTVAGGSAGGCPFDLGNFGARRGRVKLVVAGTGGVVRVGTWGKAAA